MLRSGSKGACSADWHYHAGGNQKFGYHQVDSHGSRPVSFLTLEFPATDRAPLVHLEASGEQASFTTAGAAKPQAAHQEVRGHTKRDVRLFSCIFVMHRIGSPLSRDAWLRLGIPVGVLRVRSVARLVKCLGEILRLHGRAGTVYGRAARQLLEDIFGVD